MMNPEQALQQAVGLQRSGRLAEAEQLYREILAAQPASTGARYGLGLLRAQQGRHDEALELLGGVLRENPGVVDMLGHYAQVLKAAGRREDALAHFDQALARRPYDISFLNSRGIVLVELYRFAQALAAFERVLALHPDHIEALDRRGAVLQQLRRPQDALANYDRLLTFQPGHVGALNNRACVLWDLQRREEALASFEKALACDPGNVEFLYNCANALRGLGRLAEAVERYETVLTLAPEHKYAFGNLADCALTLCDWDRTAKFATAMTERLVDRDWVIPPFTVLSYGAGPAVQRAYATRAIQDLIPVATPALWTGTRYRHDKIRVAYLSADFREHATAFLMAELFERHDHARFELVGISFGADDNSPTRARLIRAFDRFEDVRARDDRAVAELLRRLEVDIAVDLKGHTTDARPGILSHRPCPVQVQYLGYPGTMGADFIDYVIGDGVVLPHDQQPYYSEQIVRLPDCYQPNDSRRAIGASVPTRAEAGLPEDGFVFCCFNNNWKITAPLFEIWMRLLHAMPKSVLWLLADNQGAQDNLRCEAASRDIDPARLVFAPRVRPEAHLARHQLADIFLDTLLYNAHTTASDALWAGLPLITCQGQTFAGRVAASLLQAVGLPDLVTTSLAAYEDLALALARDALRLQAIRQKLAQNRLTSSLFDSAKLCRHLESAYVTMRDIAQRGEAPHGFDIARVPGSPLPKGEAKP